MLLNYEYKQDSTKQLNEFIHKHIITRELKPNALYFF